MSKIVYYLGAGASYGEPRNYFNETPSGRRRIEILSGLPVINEIVDRLISFREYINSILIPQDKSDFQIWGMKFQNAKNELFNAKTSLLEDIVWLHNETIRHATIDTFAKKLYLSNNLKDFHRLEKTLCLFLVWEQLDHRSDQRYDTFLASVLTETELQLPKDISVVSWNYDSQFELTYHNYSNNHLFVYDKFSNIKTLPDCGRIFKVNGSASFRETPTPLEIISETEDKGLALLWYYRQTEIHVDKEGFEQIRPRLSFAWEQVVENDNMMNAINDTVQDAEALVVIGYSFPFFNRSIDREIFGYMNQLETIYIQDPFAGDIKQNIQNVMSDLQKAQKINIITNTNCGQFFLPPEL